MMSNTKTFNILTGIFLALFLLMPLSVLAEDGKAIFVIGKVEVVNASGEKSLLTRGSTINSGDIILTSKGGQAQIKMIDGTLLAVRPNSEFKITSYQYNKDIATDESVYNLVKGGFRSITGKMGKLKKSSYSVKTVVGTIGIRGTDFTARICESNCGDQENGLYVGVMEGGVVLANDSGTLDVSPGDFGFMSDTGVEPTFLDEMPGDLLFAKSNKENETVALSLDEKTTNVDSTIAGIEPDELDPIATNPDLPNPNERLPAAEPDVVPDPVLALPSMGTATYTVAAHNIGSTGDFGINGPLLDAVATELSVDFAGSTITSTYEVNNMVITSGPQPGILTETWNSTGTSTFDENGNFSTALAGSGADGFGTERTISGLSSGSLVNGTETSTTAPTTVQTTFNMIDSTSSYEISGTVDFDQSTSTVP